MAKAAPTAQVPLNGTLAVEGGYLGVSTYLLLEPPKSFGTHIRAGSRGFSCSLCARSVTTKVQFPQQHWEQAMLQPATCEESASSYTIFWALRAPLSALFL